MVGRGRALQSGRDPVSLQGDAGAHQARVLWQILAPNQEGSDRALPPLWCERGFGAAYFGVLSDVGAFAPWSHHGNRMGPLAAGDPRGTVGEREREEGRDLLLWAGYASEGGRGRGCGSPTPRGSTVGGGGRGRRRGRAWTRRSKVAASTGGDKLRRW